MRIRAWGAAFVEGEDGMLKSITTWKLLLAGLLALATVFSVSNPDHAFAATFVVTSTGDSSDIAPGNGVCETATPGECTLRAAIQEANAFAGTDTIAFNIAPSGTHTITPASALPTITQPVTIDGATQPGFAGSPIIELSGSAAGPVSGLTISAGGSTVRSLVINRWGFPAAGIVLQTNGGNRIEGNYIGTDTTGTVALPNAIGVRIFSGAGNTIGGTSASARNVISGNGDGIFANGVGAGGNLIQGNLIGTDASGNLPVGNANYGIHIDRSAVATTIGGVVAGARNVISGNGFIGVRIRGSSGNVIEGNYIGTDVTGSLPLGNRFGVDIGDTSAGGTNFPASNNTVGGSTPAARNVISGNTEHGVVIGVNVGLSPLGGQNSVRGNYIGTDAGGTADVGNRRGVDITGPNNTIGGTSAADRNIISGNSESGVSIIGSAATGNLVQGNFIGTGVSGTAALGNDVAGVFIQAAASNTIGGPVVGARNVISGNNGRGVYIVDNATGNLVQGNYVGTDVNGTGALGNATTGVNIINAPNNAVGAIGAGEGNTIAYNNGDGVRIEGAATGNLVRGNSIHDNTSKGIENVFGGNAELSPPIVTSAPPAAGTTTCEGCTIDVYSDDVDEGKVYEGSVNANSGGSGPWSWSFPGALNGPNVTATVTDGSGNTSEFSPSVCVDTDSDGTCNSIDTDDDNDGVSDIAEPPCGGDPLDGALRPERVDGSFAAVDDDGDTAVDEVLPPGSENFDCDGDGYKGTAEDHVFSYLPQTNGDQKTCQAYDTSFAIEPRPSLRWPADLRGDGISFNKINVVDLGSFVSPVRRLNTSPVIDANFHVRWDLVPGTTIGKHINVTDIAALTSGSSGSPTMLGGLKAFNGPVCPYAS
jgi:CSLREA domain-containing protein